MKKKTSKTKSLKLNTIKIAQLESRETPVMTKLTGKGAACHSGGLCGGATLGCHIGW